MVDSPLPFSYTCLSLALPGVYLAGRWVARRTTGDRDLAKWPVPPFNAIDPSSPLSGPPTPDRPRRLDWAQLLKRTFAIDVQICRTCGGPMQIIAFIDDAPTARRILDHLGLPSRPPPRSTPRSSQSSLLFQDPIDPPFLVD